MKNMNDFKDFKNLKNGASLITEDVIQMGDMYRVRGFNVPISLVRGFIKKAKESGQDISNKFADTELAEMIAKYVETTFLTIENLPLAVLGNEYSAPVQVQAQVQTPVQPAQNAQAQTTAQEIPAQEIPAQEVVQPQGQNAQGGGTQGQTPVQTQTQTQGDTQEI
jgi:hypothetical protein